MERVLRDRVQQFALIGVDRRAPQMDAVLAIQCVIAALASLGCNDGIGEFELTHFHDCGADRGLQCSGRAASPNANPEPSTRHETATTQGTPISVVMSSSHDRRGIDAPCRSCRSKSSATTRAGCCGGIERGS